MSIPKIESKKADVFSIVHRIISTGRSPFDFAFSDIDMGNT